MLVTVVTSRCAVDVAIHCGVLHARPVRARLRMAVDTREHRIVRRDLVAVRANRAVVRNAEIRMVEHRPQPGGGHPGRMAGRASCRIRSGHMIRNRGAIVLRARKIGLVAAVTIRRRVTGGVVAAQMAVGARIDHWPNRARNRRAWWQHMRTLERKARRAVIKPSVGPKNRVVARRTHGGREPCGNVVWHTSPDRRRALPRRLMAPIAVRVCGSEGVVVTDMAIGAGHDFACRRQLVRTRQRPAGRGMIENCRGPRNGVVAGRAIGHSKWRSGTRVHRIVGLLPSRQMAS